MATETAPYKQLRQLAERFINAQDDQGSENFVSEKSMATQVLRDFFKFVEDDELDRVKMELAQARADAATLSDEVSRLTVNLNDVTSQRDEFKRQIDEWEKI